MGPRVVVVGLGPAGPDLVTAGTLDAIERADHRFLRTTRHPSAGLVPDARSFDHIYERASSMAEVYEDIVDELVSQAETNGEVLYAVPGSPVVAEHTVELLLIDGRIDVAIIPAMSFIDLAWVRLGVDPIAVGARVVDGHSFAVEAAGSRGPLLVAQCDRAGVLSDIKLAVEDPPELPVTVLARLGLADESVTQVAWEDLDRGIAADHLTSLWIPQLGAPVAGEVQRFDELVAVLRDECPWDRKQTHRSLSRHLLEETHEVLEVLDRLPETAGRLVPTQGGTGHSGEMDEDELGELYDQLEEELGDLLFQICFHARLAAESGRFTLADVARRVHDKLVGRHPHVFGDVEVAGADEVVANWEQLKKAEKGRESAFDGIPLTLPALAYAAKVLSRAERIGLGSGLGWPPVDPHAGDDSPTDDSAIGEALMGVVALAHRSGIDPEGALRAAATRARGQLHAREGQRQS